VSATDELARVLYETHKLALRIAEALEMAGLAVAGARTRVGAAYLKEAIQALADQALHGGAKLQEPRTRSGSETVRILTDLPAGRLDLWGLDGPSVDW
jgi:hypothetical protein